MVTTNKQIALLGGSPELAISIEERIGGFSETIDFHSLDGVNDLRRVHPDILILGSENQESAVEEIQQILTADPSLVILYIADQTDFYAMREIMRAGATDYFVLPDEFPLLETALEKAIRLVKQRDSQSVASSFKKGRGKIITFYSGKGGSGSTLMATSFAQTLRLDSTARVLLIDLNLQYGGAEYFLGIDSDRSLTDLQPVIEEVNEGHIRNVAQIEEHSGLEVLLSPRDAELAEQINDEFISKLLRASRRSYDYIVLDLPSYMNAVNLIALEEADHIYYVMNPTTPALRVYKSVERLFSRLNLHIENRLEILVNLKSRDNEITISDIKSLVDKPIAVEITRDEKNVQKAVNMGQPLRKEPNEKKIAPVARDIRKWVTALVE